MAATAHEALVTDRLPLLGLAGSTDGLPLGGASRARLIEFARDVSAGSARTEIEQHTHDLLRDLWRPDSVARRYLPGPEPGYATTPYVGHLGHQILIVTRLDRHAESAGWILTRSRPAFTLRDVEVADEILPLLVLLEGWYGDESPTRPRPGTKPVLTQRELEILQLLPLGLTAEAMGRQLGISGRTVRKHLEHIYSKLHCHDRLVAVLQAHDLQLL